MVELKKEVQRVLIPAAAPIPLRILKSSTSSSFGDALVVLSTGALRVRVVRDKGQIFADFASEVDPDTWFDSAVVLDYLGLSATAGFHSEDVVESLKGIGAFIRTTMRELASVFGKEGYAGRRKDLEAVRKRQAENAWGIKLP